MNVEILVTPDCPHRQPAIDRTREVVARLLPDVTPRIRDLGTREEALELNFPGSPTIRIDGVDLEGDPGVEAVGGLDRPAALACRRYGTGGVPPVWLVEAALLRALAPRHVLFLCVANSARSQMAEGVGRMLAGEGVRISSAGSEPTRVRSEAVAVLKELGIDPSSQRSKGVDEVASDVDAVITLCEEEVCPVWLGHATRVHWGLPDPAAVEGSEEDQLNAFREIRDELRKRLGVAFG